MKHDPILYQLIQELYLHYTGTEINSTIAQVGADLDESRKDNEIDDEISSLLARMQTKTLETAH
jgi:hypothetical protein